MDDGAKLSMELTVESGKGYVPVAPERAEDAPIGLIPVDAVYSPVRKVAYKVENTRVGQVTDHDKLSLNVITNGAVRPEDAVALAARILPGSAAAVHQLRGTARGDRGRGEG